MKTHYRPQITDHGPRTTARAFTLIELLVVISIIAVLAALSFAALGGVKNAMVRKRAQAELQVMDVTIQGYKDKLGYFPPDNPANWALNQLYYELLGTTLANGVYQTLDGSAQISAGALSATFGSTVTVFMNSTRGGGGDDAPGAVAFVKGFKPGQFAAITTPAPCSVLGAALDGPLIYSGAPSPKLNPWRYNSSSPKYNPKTFDLWIDVTVGSKTNRICNWSDRALDGGAPY